MTGASTTRPPDELAVPADAPGALPAVAATPGEVRALRWSAALTLLGLALMAWSMIQPTPMPVMLAMSAGQAIGSAAFAIYLFVVVRTLQRARRVRP